MILIFVVNLPPPLCHYVELYLESFGWKKWSLGDNLGLTPKYYIYLFNLVGYDLNQSVILDSS